MCEWTQADSKNPPREIGYYLVKVNQGNSQAIPFFPYIVIKIGKRPSWGYFIEKNGWEPTWYTRIEGPGYQKGNISKAPSVFGKGIEYRERKLLK